MKSSTIIKPSCGDGSMKAIELVSTVTNRTMFKSRCGSATAAPDVSPSAKAAAGLRSVAQ